MTYTPRKRDRYRLAAAAVTGATTVGALTATGWLGGVAAADYAEQESQRAAEQAATAAQAQRARAKYDAAVARQQSRAEGPRIVYKQRPTRTRVTVQYVAGAATAAPVGPGSTVTSSAPQQAPGGQSPNSGHQAPSAPPPPPPPPPAPAPSSGS